MIFASKINSAMLPYESDLTNEYYRVRQIHVPYLMWVTSLSK